MRITEFGEGGGDGVGDDQIVGDEGGKEEGRRKMLVPLNAKMVIVGAGARILFLPTLIYNVFRNKFEPEFHWWDQVDQFVLLGAVPFPGDVPHLQRLGVGGVVTLNERYETLVTTAEYQAYGIEHLWIPTRDYLFAPSIENIRRAVEFIHRNASQGRTTYVHCKAGRGRSTTVVLCYLIEHRNMTPEAALTYVRSKRPRVLLASSQWKAVEAYYCIILTKSLPTQSAWPSSPQTGDGVMITQGDLEGYQLSSSLPNNDFRQCLCGVMLRTTPDNSPSRDEVLVGDADLEGYDTYNQDICNDGNVRSTHIIRRLSCLFAALKISPPNSGRLAELRAC